MSTRLKYDAKSPHGQILAEAVDAIIEARSKVDRILKAVQSMSYGTPADYTQVELELGLPAGKGQDLLYFAQSMSDALHAQPLFDISGQLDQG